MSDGDLSAVTTLAHELLSGLAHGTVLAGRVRVAVSDLQAALRLDDGSGVKGDDSGAPILPIARLLAVDIQLMLVDKLEGVEHATGQGHRRRQFTRVATALESRRRMLLRLASAASSDALLEYDELRTRLLAKVSALLRDDRALAGVAAGLEPLPEPNASRGEPALRGNMLSSSQLPSISHASSDATSNSDNGGRRRRRESTKHSEDASRRSVHGSPSTQAVVAPKTPSLVQQAEHARTAAHRVSPSHSQLPEAMLRSPGLARILTTPIGVRNSGTNTTASSIRSTLDPPLRAAIETLVAPASPAAIRAGLLASCGLLRATAAPTSTAATGASAVDERPGAAAAALQLSLLTHAAARAVERARDETRSAAMTLLTGVAQRFDSAVAQEVLQMQRQLAPEGADAGMRAVGGTIETHGRAAGGTARRRRKDSWLLRGQSPTQPSPVQTTHQATDTAFTARINAAAVDMDVSMRKEAPQSPVSSHQSAPDLAAAQATWAAEAAAASAAADARHAKALADIESRHAVALADIEARIRTEERALAATTIADAIKSERARCEAEYGAEARKVEAAHTAAMADADARMTTALNNLAETHAVQLKHAQTALLDEQAAGASRIRQLTRQHEDEISKNNEIISTADRRCVELTAQLTAARDAAASARSAAVKAEADAYRARAQAEAAAAGAESEVRSAREAASIARAAAAAARDAERHAIDERDAKVEELQHVIAERDATAAYLQAARNDVADAERRASSARVDAAREISAAEAAVGAGQRDLRDAEAHARESEVALRAAHDQVAMLEATVADANRRAEASEERYVTANDKAVAVLAEVTELRSTLTATLAELQAVRLAAAESLARVKHADAERDAALHATKAAAAASTRIDELSAEVASLRSSIAQAERVMAEMHVAHDQQLSLELAKNDAQAIELRSAREAADAVRDDNARMEAEIRRLRAEASKSAEHTFALERDVSAAYEKIHRLSAMENNVTSHEDGHDITAASVDQLQRKDQEVISVIAKLQDKLARVTHERNTIVADMEHEINLLRAELTAARSNADAEVVRLTAAHAEELSRLWADAEAEALRREAAATSVSARGIEEAQAEVARLSREVIRLSDAAERAVQNADRDRSALVERVDAQLASLAEQWTAERDAAAAMAADAIAAASADVEKHKRERAALETRERELRDSLTATREALAIARHDAAVAREELRVLSIAAMDARARSEADAAAYDRNILARDVALKAAFQTAVSMLALRFRALVGSADLPGDGSAGIASHAATSSEVSAGSAILRRLAEAALQWSSNEANTEPASAVPADAPTSGSSRSSPPATPRRRRTTVTSESAAPSAKDAIVQAVSASSGSEVQQSVAGSAAADAAALVRAVTNDLAATVLVPVLQAAATKVALFEATKDREHGDAITIAVESARTAAATELATVRRELDIARVALDSVARTSEARLLEAEATWRARLDLRRTHTREWTPEQQLQGSKIATNTSSNISEVLHSPQVIERDRDTTSTRPRDDALLQAATEAIPREHSITPAAGLANLAATLPYEPLHSTVDDRIGNIGDDVPPPTDSSQNVKSRHPRILSQATYSTSAPANETSGGRTNSVSPRMSLNEGRSHSRNEVQEQAAGGVAAPRTSNADAGLTPLQSSTREATPSPDVPRKVLPRRLNVSRDVAVEELSSSQLRISASSDDLVDEHLRTRRVSSAIPSGATPPVKRNVDPFSPLMRLTRRAVSAASGVFDALLPPDQSATIAAATQGDDAASTRTLQTPSPPTINNFFRGYAGGLLAMSPSDSQPILRGTGVEEHLTTNPRASHSGAFSRPTLHKGAEHVRSVVTAEPPFEVATGAPKTVDGLTMRARIDEEPLPRTPSIEHSVTNAARVSSNTARTTDAVQPQREQWLDRVARAGNVDAMRGVLPPAGGYSKSPGGAFTASASRAGSVKVADQHSSERADVAIQPQSSLSSYPQPREAVDRQLPNAATASYPPFSRLAASSFVLPQAPIMGAREPIENTFVSQAEQSGGAVVAQSRPLTPVASAELAAAEALLASVVSDLSIGVEGRHRVNVDAPRNVLSTPFDTQAERMLRRAHATLSSPLAESIIAAAGTADGSNGNSSSVEHDTVVALQSVARELLRLRMATTSILAAVSTANEDSQTSNISSTPRDAVASVASDEVVESVHDVHEELRDIPMAPSDPQRERLRYEMLLEAMRRRAAPLSQPPQKVSMQAVPRDGQRHPGSAGGAGSISEAEPHV